MFSQPQHDKVRLDRTGVGLGQGAPEALQEPLLDVFLRALQQSVGEVGQLFGHFRDGRDAEQVTDGDAEDVHPLEASQGQGQLIIGPAGRLPAERRTEVLHGGHPVEVLVLESPFEQLGVAQESVG